TIVSWCHKVADSVSSKFDAGSIAGKWLGRAVATVFVPFGIMPSLVGDTIHGIKSLYDRCVEKKEIIDTKMPTKEEFAALTEEIETLKIETKRLNDRALTAEAAADEGRRNFEILCNESSQHTTAMTERAEQAEAKHKHEMQNAESKLCAQAEQYNKKIEELKADITIKQQTITELTSNYEKLRLICTKNSQTIESFKGDIKKLENEKSTLQKELSKAGEQISDCEKQIDDLKKELTAEKNKSPQDKYLEEAFKGLEDSNDPDSKYEIIIPGSERAIRINFSELTRFKEGVNTLDAEIKEVSNYANDSYYRAMGLNANSSSCLASTDEDSEGNGESSLYPDLTNFSLSDQNDPDTKIESPESGDFPKVMNYPNYTPDAQVSDSAQANSETVVEETNGEPVPESVRF
ncbi:hypothetical protein, partial [Endozoicomonas sp. ONNA2]|uniref:hypothetical protein n=1 Tax=Endozoicomonas sp. ONNA2 TaxID=2828741 RepID=UPI0021475E76